MDATDHGGQTPPPEPNPNPDPDLDPTASSGGNRLPVRIAGPAHRRPESPRLRRRHIVAWCIVAVMASTVLVQWCISTINGADTERNSAWTGPPASSLPPSPPVTVTATPTDTPTRSPGSSTLPPHIPVPVNTPNSVPSPNRTHKPRPLITGPPVARITAPGPGTTVSGGPGVLMTGTAAHLGGRQIEIFDFAPNGVYYLASDGGPVPVSGGHWSFQDATIGDGDRDVGKSFVLTVVIADSQCRSTLRSTPRDGQNNIAYTTLPSGCRDADHVRVVKTAA